MTDLIKLGQVYFKREDQNNTGSAKDRAIGAQVEYLIKLGFRQAVISSSGNAAISAQQYCLDNNIQLDVFVSPDINPSKLKLIDKCTTHQTPKPISGAFKFAKTNNAYFLRQSTDPIAIAGYGSIGDELVVQLPQITSVFFPVGSGTTLYGVTQKLPPDVKFFAVQPASHCPIASLTDTDFKPEDFSITDALSVKLLPLKNKVVSAIKKSGGSGIVVQNDNTIEALAYLKNNNITTSAEGALAYAGYIKASKFHDTGDFPVILLTGAAR